MVVAALDGAQSTLRVLDKAHRVANKHLSMHIQAFRAKHAARNVTSWARSAPVHDTTLVMNGTLSLLSQALLITHDALDSQR